MSSSINSGYTKRLPFGSPLVRIRPHLVLGYSRKKSSSVRSIEKEVEKVDNTVAKEEAEEIVADGQSNINSTQHNVPPKKLKVAIKTRLIELTNEIERIQKPLRPSSRVKFTSEWLRPSSSEADEFSDTPVEDDQPEINSTTDSISSDDDNTFGSHNTSDDDDDYATALQNMSLDDFDKEVNRRRKEREAKVNNAESIDTNNNDSTENSFNIDNDNNTASTSSDIVDKHDTVNDNDNHTNVVTDNGDAPVLARKVRATRGVSRRDYKEPSQKTKLRREDVENASTSACNVTQPIPQSISTRGSRVGRKARSTTTCYKEPSSKTKLRREP